MYYSWYYRKGIFLPDLCLPEQKGTKLRRPPPKSSLQLRIHRSDGISKFLAIYLNDHFAAATAGVELARRVLKSNPRGSLGELLRRLVVEMDEQREVLEQVMEENDTPRSRVKVAAVRLGESLGRLKLNGRLFGYSPLSRVVELEGLYLVSHMQLMLWQTVGQLVQSDGLTGIDSGYLETQTLDHIRSIKSELDQAVKLAFLPDFAGTSEGN